MKYDLKTLSLTILLGSLYFFISNYTKNKLISNNSKINNKEVLVINKIEKSSKLIAPKVNIDHVSIQNGLELGNNWKSK